MRDYLQDKGKQATDAWHKNQEKVRKGVESAGSVRFQRQDGTWVSVGEQLRELETMQGKKYWEMKRVGRLARWRAAASYLDLQQQQVFSGHGFECIGNQQVVKISTGELWIVVAAGGDLRMGLVWGVSKTCEGGLRPHPALELKEVERIEVYITSVPYVYIHCGRLLNTWSNGRVPFHHLLVPKWGFGRPWGLWLNTTMKSTLF